MNWKAVYSLLWLSFLQLGIASAQEQYKDFAVLKEPYLGQKPPGREKNQIKEE